MLKKVVSGGQTGVDQAALRAAQDSDLKVGGWCPPGCVSEEGQIPLEFSLKETPKERSESAPHVARSQRTEWNIRDSDATLVLRSSVRNLEDKGTEWTEEYAASLGRPFLVCDPKEKNTQERVKNWIIENNIQVLNVGGPAESTELGVGETSYNFLMGIFQK